MFNALPTSGGVLEQPGMLFLKLHFVWTEMARHEQFEKNRKGQPIGD